VHPLGSTTIVRHNGSAAIFDIVPRLSFANAYCWNAHR
jgi:hypothetical protein